MVAQAQYLFVRPNFMLDPPGLKSAIAVLHLPPWFPDPCRIVRTMAWVQGPGPFSTSVYGDVAVAIDPRGEYVKMAGWPVTENEYGIFLKTISVFEFIPNAKHLQEMTFDPPVEYSSSAGDCIVFAPEGGGGIDIQYFLGVWIEVDGEIIPPHGPNVRLMIRGDGNDGERLIRDWSSSNHQIDGFGGFQISTNAPPPGTVSSIVFDGLNGYLSWRDRMYDVRWPGDFRISAKAKTSDASLNQSRHRHIFSGGPMNSQHAAVIITPSGMLAFGNEASGANVVGTSNIADGAWHAIEVSRSAGMVKLRIDDVVEGSVFDDTTYIGTAPTIGRFAGGGGHWSGYLRDISISKG